LPPWSADDLAGNEGSEDCSGAPATRPATLLYNNIRGPGYDNVLFEIATNDSGAITSGYAWWTREFQVNAGPVATNTLDENSYTGGLLLFTSPGLDLPTGENPADTDNEPACANWPSGEVDLQPSAVNDSATATVNAARSTSSPTIPGDGDLAAHTLAITQDASTGSCTADNAAKTVSYTGDTAGTFSCQYSLADEDGDTSNATVTITVSSGGGGGGGGSQVSLPGGGSSLDLLALAALLGGLPLVRRRRFSSRELS
jgi:hypothetical protein